MPAPRKRPPAPLDAQGLFDYSLKVLAGRALSISELRDRLRRKAAQAGDVPGVLARLREYGYLDDTRMAETFAAARKDSRGFGKMRVLRDLQARRVAPAVAREAVDQAFEGADETRMIEEYLERKYRNDKLPALLQDEKKLASVFRRLRTAGFSAGNSIRVLKRYAARADELAEMDEQEPET